MRLRLLYWKFANFLVKAIGYSFIAVGLPLGLYFVFSLLPGGTVSVDGQPSTDMGNRIIVVAMPWLVAFLGWLMTRARPYYPSDIKAEIEENEQA